MNRPIRNDDKRESKRRPPYLDNYTLDPATGIYKPESYDSSTGHERSGSW